MWLPYGGLTMKILEHVGFNFEVEEISQEYTGIENGTLNQMQKDIKYGVLSYKSSKEKESF